MVNTDTKEQIMSGKILNFLEKLVDMFPEQDYQSRLEVYISSKNPQSTSDIEHLERQFHSQQGGFL
jgi:hypothetical protein